MEHCITLDNDLGENALEGYDAVKRLVDLGISAKWWNIHSENVVAADNMHAYLSNAMYYHKINEATITNYKTRGLHEKSTRCD